MIIRALTINFDSMHEKLGFCAVEIEWCMCFMAKNDVEFISLHRNDSDVFSSSIFLFYTICIVYPLKISSFNFIIIKLV